MEALRNTPDSSHVDVPPVILAEIVSGGFLESIIAYSTCDRNMRLYRHFEYFSRHILSTISTLSLPPAQSPNSPPAPRNAWFWDPWDCL